MENQHRKISGYRELSQDEINCMNKIKALAEEVGKLIDYLGATHAHTLGNQIDPRWLSDGKTDLQKGFMSLVRAVAQPTTF